MKKELERIQEEKTKEAQEFFMKYNVLPAQEDYYTNDIIPEFSENSKSGEENKFHWTRLSINSNIGCVIE
ncbi:MAG: hypothetical protein QM640_02640 [Niabella sp.]